MMDKSYAYLCKHFIMRILFICEKRAYVLKYQIENNTIQPQK